jgi:hypothetical protein
MDNREWIYNGLATKSNAWINGTVGFLKKAFGEAAKGSQRMSCPYTNYKNEKRKRQDDVIPDFKDKTRKKISHIDTNKG